MKITLRTKNLKDGRIAHYLDIYHKGIRQYDYLGMHISPEDSNETRQEIHESIEAKMALRRLESCNQNVSH